jgi:hypothetical protein
MLVGTVAGGWQMARAALVATSRIAAGEDDAGFYKAKIATAHFYAEQSLPLAVAHAQSVLVGEGAIMALSEEDFSLGQM